MIKFKMPLLLLACLACEDLGLHVQTDIEQLQGDPLAKCQKLPTAAPISRNSQGQGRAQAKLDLLSSLTRLFLIHNPAIAFNRLGVCSHPIRGTQLGLHLEILRKQRCLCNPAMNVRDPSTRQQTNRKEFLGTTSTLLSPLLVLPLAARADVVEGIRKGAAFLPGYGAPDLLFPPVFRGRWRVSRSVVDVQTPLGADKAPKDELADAQRAASKGAVEYDQRFVATNDADYGDKVILDRAFNTEQREGATSGLSSKNFEAQWSASNPNVITVRNRQSGSLIETKVTKRSTENPGEGAFGTSEYARVADVGSSGPMSNIPRILATRQRVRYKWDNSDPQPSRIEAIAIENLFDPQATGFADLSGATPVLTVKVRLAFVRP